MNNKSDNVESFDSSSPLHRSVPGSEFVDQIDILLEKDDPETSIPWSKVVAPSWASAFRPKVIVDLGCGAGAFTEAILSRLADWGCLNELEKLVLIEGDAGIFNEGEAALEEVLRTRVERVLQKYNLIETTNLEIEVKINLLEIDVKKPKEGFLNNVMPPDMSADLIIASHLTYYFGDGSGIDLISALNRHLETNGLAWIVIRNLECPIYRTRRAVIEKMGRKDPKPLDYSESFQLDVLPNVRDFELVDSCSHGYLGEVGSLKRFDAAYLLMWRELSPSSMANQLSDAVNSILNMSEPLFKERHFILRKK